MEKWMHTLRDRTRVTVTGAKPERVLNTCARESIAFSDVQKVGDYQIDFTVPTPRVGDIEKIAAKSQCEVEKQNIKSVPRLLRRTKRRWWLAALLLLACVTAAVSGLFVWEVRVTGNETISTGRILRALEDSGVGYGTFWPGMHIDTVRSAVQRRVPELGWFTVNMRGSCAEVVVQERVEPPKVVDNDTPMELYSTADGVILRMAVLQGESLVQRGDFVTAGQVLVSGTVHDRQEGVRPAYALGSVRARTAYELTAQAPLQTARKTADSKTHTRWALCLGKKRINFYKSGGISTGECDTIYTEYVCAIPGVFRLPLSLLREQTQTFTVEEQAASEDALRELLQAQLTETLARKIGADGEVITSNFTAAVHDGVLIVTLRAECEQEIAAERPCDLIIPPTEEGLENDRTND